MRTATLAVVATVALFGASLRWVAGVSVPNLFGWKQLTMRPVVSGAVAGGYSHIVLDSLMHPDIQPLWPYSAANALAGIVSLSGLHWTCIALGIVGIVIVGARQRVHRQGRA